MSDRIRQALSPHIDAIRRHFKHPVKVTLVVRDPTDGTGAHDVVIGNDEWTTAIAAIKQLEGVAGVELDDDVRRWFEIYDRPCDPNGMWPHVTEFKKQDDRLRRLVGAKPRPPR